MRKGGSFRAREKHHSRKASWRESLALNHNQGGGLARQKVGGTAWQRLKGQASAVGEVIPLSASPRQDLVLAAL